MLPTVQQNTEEVWLKPVWDKARCKAAAWLRSMCIVCVSPFVLWHALVYVTVNVCRSPPSWQFDCASDVISLRILHVLCSLHVYDYMYSAFRNLQVSRGATIRAGAEANRCLLDPIARKYVDSSSYFLRAVTPHRCSPCPRTRFLEQFILSSDSECSCKVCFSRFCARMLACLSTWLQASVAIW